MKSYIFLFLLFSTFHAQSQDVITRDIVNFWKAYDKITKTKDSIQQIKLLEELYFAKGTEGLQAIRKARNYTSQDYLYAINNYPKFWNSVRKNTMKSKKISKELNLGIEQLRIAYPELKPAKIYFTIGALRTNGTIMNNLVLIGSELAMTDKHTLAEEFPENIKNARRLFFDSEPINNIVLLNVHEYVHTQQNKSQENLLSYVIHEGVAEFVSTKAMHLSAIVPAITFGKNNPERVRAKFEEEMFNINNLYKWLWGDAVNEFGVRDLGYYIGYQICENYYIQAINKQQAIKEMIELDYNDDAEIDNFIKKSNFFSKDINDLNQDYERTRPTVVSIKQFNNNSQQVNPTIKEITIEFSEALNGFNTGIDYGDLGSDGFPKNDVTKRYWAKDNKSWTIPVTLEANKKYQLLLTSNFRSKKGIPLKPYLIEFETGNE